MSPANAPRVERVLAVAGGVVREVYRPTQWLPSPVEGLENRIGFDPDFVYRHRPVKPAVSTAVLAQALASMTKRVDDFADKAGYDS